MSGTSIAYTAATAMQATSGSALGGGVDVMSDVDSAPQHMLSAPLESLQKPHVCGLFGRSDTNPFDRHCVQLCFIGSDALAHAPYQALHLIIAA
jgi:hypothetical protein